MIIVTGRVVDEHGAPLGGVRVVALGDWLLTTEKLSKPVTVASTGLFILEVVGVEGGTSVPPSFRVRFEDPVGRQVCEDKEVPGTVQNHELSDVTVRHADFEGLAVTNLTGQANFASDGNAVKLLVDGKEAFGRIADDINGASQSVNMTQLFFALPEEFKHEKSKEKPALVFKFVTKLDPENPRPTTPSDERPERLLISEAVAHTTVRILLNDPGIGWPEGVFWLVVLSALAVGAGVGGVALLGAFLGIGIPLLLVAFGILLFEIVEIAKKLDEGSDVHETMAYFTKAILAEASAAPKIIVRGFPQALPDNGVMHCKMVITDEQRAVVVGSPFSQRYFDFFGHRIDDPHRGSNTSDMVHDLSIAVVGPAVHHLYETFLHYWNEDLPKAEELPKLPEGLDPNTQVSGEDAISRVQVVRTLSGKRLKKLGKGEKGILEGYLRAFAAAKHYIYLENQYFTDSVITDALIQALKRNQELELILLVPIKPDVIFYPRRQAYRIKQLRKAAATQVGVFTRWTYADKPGRPMVAPVYIHAKGAVVDDSWVTIGSANLDGLSLDYNLALSPLVFGETTATELNINVLPEVQGQPTKFGELMRRRLFAEHLGIPDPNDHSLDFDPDTRWLTKLWLPAATKALEHVRAAKHAALPGFVLEYPKEDGGWLDTPRKHLAALGVSLKPSQAVIRPITGTRKFDFFKGEWDKTPELEDIRQ